MRERVQVFTHASPEGSSVGEDLLQDMINDWLAETQGQIVNITQSESHRPGKAQHITLCVWYIPKKPSSG